MPKFVVISPVEHNGRRFEVGTTINLAAEFSDALLAAGAIASPAEVLPPASSPESNPPAAGAQAVVSPGLGLLGGSQA